MNRHATFGNTTIFRYLGLPAGVAFISIVGCSAEVEQPRAASEWGALQAFVDHNEQVSKEMHLVARLNLGQSLVEWYEPHPGKILVLEAGIDKALMHQAELGQPPVDAFKALAPAMEVPRELVDAQARAILHESDPLPPPPADLPKGYGGAPTPVLTEPIRPGTLAYGPLAYGPLAYGPEQLCSAPPVQNGSFDPVWFHDNACGPQRPNFFAGDWTIRATWCLWDWWNHAYYYCNSGWCSSGYGAVAAAIGTSFVIMYSQLGGPYQWSVPEGNWIWFQPGMARPGNHIWFNFEVRNQTPSAEFYFCGEMVD
jgi:hypothetical protein